ncbi:MAG: hypothetical protein MI923_21990 [Phycisphaerales bacterium]|nr:hypothetical protein [Phycisphaerales bacterium]
MLAFVVFPSMEDGRPGLPQLGMVGPVLHRTIDFPLPHRTLDRVGQLGQQAVVVLDRADDDDLRLFGASFQNGLVEPLVELGPGFGTVGVLPALDVVEQDEVGPILDVASAADVLAPAHGQDLHLVVGDDLVASPARRAGIAATALADVRVVLGQPFVVDEFVLDLFEEVAGLVSGVGDEDEEAAFAMADDPEGEDETDEGALRAAARRGDGESRTGLVGQDFEDGIQLRMHSAARLLDMVGEVQFAEGRQRLLHGPADLGPDLGFQSRQLEVFTHAHRFRPLF